MVYHDWCMGVATDDDGIRCMLVSMRLDRRIVPRSGHHPDREGLRLRTHRSVPEGIPMRCALTPPTGRLTAFRHLGVELGPS